MIKSDGQLFRGGGGEGKESGKRLPAQKNKGRRYACGPEEGGGRKTPVPVALVASDGGVGRASQLGFTHCALLDGVGTELLERSCFRGMQGSASSRPLPGLFVRLAQQDFLKPSAFKSFQDNQGKSF